MIQSQIQQWAVEAIKLEAEAIARLTSVVNNQFEEIVKLIYHSKGRLVLTGIGKSAIIGAKIVATLNSTGTPALFMHAADAIHGDLGMLQKEDLVLCISKSGNTPEIKVILPLIRNLGNTVIGMVSNADSYLAQHADYVLYAQVESEACPINLAPTTSTTVQLVLGDAIAICLLRLRGFTEQDFARFHPGGALGKKLYLRVSDIIKALLPKVSETADIQSVIIEISSKMLGATAVVNTENIPIGIITDGDLRRMLEKNIDYKPLQAKDIMSSVPKSIDAEELAFQAFNIMEHYAITQLLVTRNGQYCGMLHLHDILREGIV